MEMYQLRPLPSLSEQAIVVARKRKWSALFPFIPAICLLLIEFLLLVMLSYTAAYSTFFVDHFSDLSKEVKYLSLSVMWILTILWSAWAIWSTFARPFFARGPVLVINREGIQIGKTPGFLLPGGDFVRWENIEAICLKRAGKVFALSLKDSRAYVSQFGFWKQLAIRLNLLLNDGFLSVPQTHMKQSAQHVFQQLSQAGADELSSYGVRLEHPHK